MTARQDDMMTSDRELLARLSRAARGGLLSVADAAKAMGVSRRAASTRLSSLTRRGWLTRARRGLYLVRPLEAEPGKPTIAEDPWTLAREAFSPCYIGGWSAAEHWGLTEQLFRSTLVVTAANVRSRSIELLGHTFRLFKVAPSRLDDGLVPVWRGAERIPVSTRERTIVDCARNPELCGGIRQLGEMMREYGSTPAADFQALLNVAESAANGAAWKRIGYLAENIWPAQPGVVLRAQERLSSGYAKLDPTVDRRGRLTRRWRLWVNARVDATASQLNP